MLSENKDFFFFLLDLLPTFVFFFTQRITTRSSPDQKIYKFSMISLESKFWSGRRSVADGWCGSWWENPVSIQNDRKESADEHLHVFGWRGAWTKDFNWIRQRVIIHGCSENWGVLCGGGSGLNTDFIHKMAAKGLFTLLPHRARDPSESWPDVSHR